MSMIRFRNGIEKKSDYDLIGFSKAVNTSMTDNPNFAAPVPALSVVTAATTLLEQMVADIKAGDSSLVLAKNAKRDELIQLLHNLSNYVLFTAAGNRTIAGSAGFPFAKQSTPRIITAPKSFNVSMGLNRGSIKVSVSRVAGAFAYMHQYTTDPNMAPNSWITNTCTATSCIISGLAPGVTIYVRVGVVGANGQVVFTSVETCIPQ